MEQIYKNRNTKNAIVIKMTHKTVEQTYQNRNTKNAIVIKMTPQNSGANISKQKY